MIRTERKATVYANINLEGRVVNDPEIKTGKGDKKYVTFRIVVNRQYGEQQLASFFTCTGNEQVAGRIEKGAIKKGSLIHVSGSLSLRDYTDRDGNLRTSADIGIQDWHYAGAKPKTDDQAGGGGSSNQTAAGETPGTINPEQCIDDEGDLPL